MGKEAYQVVFRDISDEKNLLKTKLRADIAEENFKKAAEIIKNAKHVCAFTGAGISVESGIPTFRGENGLWNIYDPSFIEIENFYREYAACWVLIKKIFYDYFGKAKPNEAHIGLAKMESVGYVKSIITQNIDNLHTSSNRL